MAYAQKGLKSILQKSPNDVVILSALRTPITRAYRGGLRNAYPEQMLAAVCQKGLWICYAVTERRSRFSKQPWPPILPLTQPTSTIYP